jgi:hypothetical protein
MGMAEREPMRRMEGGVAGGEWSLALFLEG